MNRYLGIGVLIGALIGNENTVNSHKKAVGKVISKIYIDEDYLIDGALIVKFTDNTGIAIFDDGRSCCERRYIHTDDDLDYYVTKMVTPCHVTMREMRSKGWETQ